MLYDTHAHLDFPDFASDLAEVLARAKAAGITRIITVGTDLESSRRAIALAERFPEVYAVAGWHPGHVTEAPSNIEDELRKLADHPKVVALGETGIDHYRLPSTRGGSEQDDRIYKERQTELFRQHLEVAAELGLNVVIHQRAALEPTFQIFEPYAGRLKGVFHCFGEAPEVQKRIAALGSLVSFTGIVTFKKSELVQETVRQAGVDEFMLETDSPYLAPVPHRRERCEPAFVRDTAERIAELRGCTLEQLGEATCAAAHKFFTKLA